MRIKIISLDRSEVIQVGDANGYRGEFTCPMVSGTAIFVPDTGREEFLVPGAVLSVETSQEEVTDFSIIPNDIVQSIAQLPQTGAYHVSGKVSLNGDDELFIIDVGDFTFNITIYETKGIIPQKGDSVEFILYGLSLWVDWPWPGSR